MPANFLDSLGKCGCFEAMDLIEAALGAFLGTAATAGCVLAWYRSKYVSSHICCYYAGTLLSTDNFYLLVTRKDEEKSSILENTVVSFKYCSESEQLQARVKHRENMGFQFKSFVDYGHIPYPRVKKELEDMGFTNVSKGKGKRENIAWFNIPNYPISPHSSHGNNIFYPI